VNGPEDEGEGDLPWPQPDDDDHAAELDTGEIPAVATETIATDHLGEPEENRVERRARREAQFRRRRRIVALVAGAVLVVVLGFVLWYELESHALGPPGKQVVVTVKPGESTGSVISTLSDKGVIGSSLAFQISDVFHGTPTVQAGSYAMRQNQTFAEVRALLAAGPNIYPVNVLAGYTLSEVATQVSAIPGHTAASFEKAAASGTVHSVFSPPGSNNLEGLLGIGQYLILPGESDLTIVRNMVTRFDRYATGVGLNAASAAALGMTPYEVITVASITEKEGYYTFNMPKVARVIYNRLARGIPLQMDSTVLYAIGQDGGAVTSHDLQIQSPYNTYLNKGLTPTPICMPSVTALTSALHPPPGGWLYFVLVQKNGVMAFSDTYAEQQANEQLARSRGLP
jgi:UPF0755 protein